MKRLVLVAASVFASCAGTERSRPDEPPSWNLGARPLVVISDSSVPTGHELNGVSSALVLSDGSILLANAGLSELGLFDSSGRFVRTVGRKGQGPGEFEGSVSVFRWRGDSVVVFDPAMMRWTFLDPRLDVSRTSSAPDPAILQPTWLYQGAIVADGVLSATPTWAVSVLDSLRGAIDPKFTHLFRARRDDLGALWFRTDAELNQWDVYTASGAPVGRTMLPEGLEPLQIGQDFVLGLIIDSLGLEEIRLYSLDRPVTPSSDNTSSATVAVDSTILLAMPRIITAQEVQYSSYGRYSSRQDSLRIVPPLTFRLVLLGGDERHWSGVGIHPVTGVTCGVSVGWPAPIGWVDGTPFCGR